MKTPALLHSVRASFEAARRLDSVRQGRIHGHRFLAGIQAALPTGWRSFPGGETQALEEALNAGVAVLDYGDLNEILPVPSDAQLARWLIRHLGIPGLDSLGIQSTADRGVILDASGSLQGWRRFHFEAAHRLPRVPEGHPCGRMHGHGFAVILQYRLESPESPAPPNPPDLEALWAPFHHRLHLRCLNDIPGLENPTSEQLAAWLWRALEPRLPALSGIRISETATAGCHYDGTRFRIWKERRFESALRLLQAPEGDPRRSLHGHSYRLRLYLTAPLDQVLGWTLDYGDVKALFQPTYRCLDHHCLDGLAGLPQPDLGHLVHWIREEAAPHLPALDGIALQETPHRGVLLHWGEGPPTPPVP